MINKKMNAHHIKLNLSALMVVVIVTMLPSIVYAEVGVGKIQFSVGNVTATGADGVSRILAKGADINNGDTIKTSDGRAQVRFIDGGYMSFQPDTEFKVEEYHFSGQADGSEKGFFKLVKGGLRAITGLIGKSNKQAWRMNTPVATIGIRGTETLDEFRNGILKVTVGDGAAYIENDLGNLILYKGQTGEVTAFSAPKFSSTAITIAARAPKGANPVKNKQEQESEQDNRSVFSVSSARREDGIQKLLDSKLSATNLPTPTPIVPLIPPNYFSLFAAGSLTSTDLPALNLLGASADYYAIKSISLDGNTATLTSELDVNFANYKADFTVTSNDFSGGSLSGKHIEGHSNGMTLNSSNGVITPCGCGVLGTYDVSHNLIASGTLSLGATRLNAVNISQATMTYSIHEGVSNASQTINNQILTSSALIIP